MELLYLIKLVSFNHILYKLVYSFITDFLPLSNKDNTYFTIIFILVILLIQIYLASDRSKGLNTIAFIGTCFTLFLGLTIILEFPVNITNYLSIHQNKKYYFQDINLITISSFPILVKNVCVYFYSFQYHAGSLIIMETISDKSEVRIKSVFKNSVWISFLFYYSIMLFGYLGDLNVSKEIFINNSSSSVFMSISKLLYSASLIFNISFTYIISQKYIENVITFGKAKQLSVNTKNIIMFIVLTLLMLLAFTFDSVINILSLIGGSTQTVQMFLIPFLLYIKKVDVAKWRKYIAFLIMIVLICLGMFSLVLFLFDLFGFN